MRENNLITADYPDGLQSFNPSHSELWLPQEARKSTFIGHGDSRQGQQNNGGYKSFTCNHPMNVANALNGHNMEFVANFGVSGYRSDQYLSDVIMAQALQTPSEWAVFMSGAVNDISQAPFTDQLSGASITASNVAYNCANNIRKAAEKYDAQGRKILIFGEYGSTAMTQAQVGQVMEFNRRIKDICIKKGWYYFDTATYLLNPTGSAAAVVFKTGYSTDGTHLSPTGAYAIGVPLAAWLSKIIPPAFILPTTISDVFATNPLQLILNPLFNTTSGGATDATAPSITGNIPGSCRMANTAGAATSVNISSAAGAYGNDITLAITTAGADTISFYQGAIPAANWSLTDIIQAGIQVDVANGSSNFMFPYFQNQLVGDGGTNGENLYDMQSIGNYNGPSTAYTLTLASTPTRAPLTATTKSWESPYLYLKFTAAGSATVTLRQMFCSKMMIN